MLPDTAFAALAALSITVCVSRSTNTVCSSGIRFNCGTQDLCTPTTNGIGAQQTSSNDRGRIGIKMCCHWKG